MCLVELLLPVIITCITFIANIGSLGFIVTYYDYGYISTVFYSTPKWQFWVSIRNFWHYKST